MHLTREQLYEKIWSVPCRILAKDFGISDVALAKACKRLGIPRPGLGYWARVAAGQTVTKTPLPPRQPGQDEVLSYNVERNQERRKEWAMSSAKPGMVAKEIELPGETDALHPAAQRFREAFSIAKVKDDGRVHIRKRNLPRVTVSHSLAEKVVRVVHALVTEVEASNMTLHPGSEDHGLEIRRDNDAITFEIDEPCNIVEREPTLEEKRRPSSTWNLTVSQPSGRLVISLHSEQGLTGHRKWTEKENKPIETFLQAIMERLDQFFHLFVTRRADEEQRRKDREEAERKYQEEQRQKSHQDALEQVIATRVENLMRAAEWHRIHQQILEYIGKVETTWRSQSAELSETQTNWLIWARKMAENFSPFVIGYPKPTADGAFNSKEIHWRTVSEYARNTRAADTQSTPGERVWLSTAYSRSFPLLAFASTSLISSQVHEFSPESWIGGDNDAAHLRRIAKAKNGVQTCSVLCVNEQP
jgi:hypothetical protein